MNIRRYRVFLFERMAQVKGESIKKGGGGWRKCRVFLFERMVKIKVESIEGIRVYRVFFFFFFPGKRGIGGEFFMVKVSWARRVF